MSKLAPASVLMKLSDFTTNRWPDCPQPDNSKLFVVLAHLRYWMHEIRGSPYSEPPIGSGFGCHYQRSRFQSSKPLSPPRTRTSISIRELMNEDSSGHLSQISRKLAVRRAGLQSLSSWSRTSWSALKSAMSAKSGK